MVCVAFVVYLPDGGAKEGNGERMRGWDGKKEGEVERVGIGSYMKGVVVRGWFRVVLWLRAVISLLMVVRNMLLSLMLVVLVAVVVVVTVVVKVMVVVVMTAVFFCIFNTTAS